jgi:NAD(P)-dependent dehydrogenase (short-subunit alcohol dehydrogenase family)
VVAAIPDRFDGKRAIVTGASRGIGRATALRLAAEGAAVGLIARGRPGLEAVHAEISEGGGTAYLATADCSNEAQISQAIDELVGSLGGLDILVANAAVELPKDDDRLDRITLDGWNRLIVTNLNGQFLTCKHGLKHLLAAGSGAIVCLGSNCGYLGMAYNEPAYSASKGGIFAMMKVMAIDFARHNIRVNMVIPGFIDTERRYAEWYPEFRERPPGAPEQVKEIPLRRLGRSEDIADACVFLASDASSYVTGDTIRVMGGRIIG